MMLVLPSWIGVRCFLTQVPNSAQFTLSKGINDNKVNHATDRSKDSSRNSKAETVRGLARDQVKNSRNSRNSSKNQQIQFESEVPSTICLSHREDVDGLSSAPLVKSAFKNCYIVLLDYSNLIRHLKRISYLISASAESIASGSLNTEVHKANVRKVGDDDKVGNRGV